MVAFALRLRNDLHCVGWGVKLFSLTHPSLSRQNLDQPQYVSFSHSLGVVIFAVFSVTNWPLCLPPVHVFGTFWKGKAAVFGVVHDVRPYKQEGCGARGYIFHLRRIAQLNTLEFRNVCPPHIFWPGNAPDLPHPLTKCLHTGCWDVLVIISVYLDITSKYLRAWYCYQHLSCHSKRHVAHHNGPRID